MEGMKQFLLVLTQFTLLRRTNIVGSQNNNKKKSRYVLMDSCRLDTNFFNLILHSLFIYFQVYVSHNKYDYRQVLD
jgi:hypothetical protein